MTQWLKGWLAVVVILMGLGFAGVADLTLKISKWCEEVAKKLRGDGFFEAAEDTCDPQEWRK